MDHSSKVEMTDLGQARSLLPSAALLLVLLVAAILRCGCEKNRLSIGLSKLPSPMCTHIHILASRVSVSSRDCSTLEARGEN